MTERPELHELRTATGIHSFVRYAFAARFVGGKRVLDIACGNGFGTVILAEHAAAVVGADVAADAVATARRTFARTNVTYEVIRPGTLPFPDGAFDVVVCLETIEHVARDQQPAFLRELRRVLAKDGVLVLSTPDRDVERRYELVTGAANPWHLYTPRLDELHELDALAHRRFFREAELVATVARARDSGSRPRFAADMPPVTTPVSLLAVFASSAEQLEGAAANAPVSLRQEPRLEAVDATMDALPARLRLADESFEQLRRVESALADGVVPGSTRWWHRQAAYAFAAGLSSGRRVLDLGAGMGHGAARLALNAREVVATSGAGVLGAVARALYPEVRFVDEETLAGLAGEFDLVICWSEGGSNPEARVARAMDRLSPTGVLISDIAPAGMESRVIEIVDCVATCVVGDGNVTLAGREGDWHGATGGPTALLFAVARSDAAIAVVQQAEAVALARGDFQRDALIAETLMGRGVPDVGGFPPDERHDLFAVLLSRAHASARAALENRIAEQAGEIASLRQRIELLEERRPLVTARSLMLRLQGLFRS